jgi:hypothetical protein
MRVPSGLKATQLTVDVCPQSVRASLPVAASQTLTIFSRLPTLARRLPSGLKATLWTEPAWPLRVRASPPLAASQTLTVLS